MSEEGDSGLARWAYFEEPDREILHRPDQSSEVPARSEGSVAIGRYVDFASILLFDR
jgi:hypothetical protein